MAKSHASFVCQNCGAVAQRWQGRCEACGEWNTIAEESAASGIGAQSHAGRAQGPGFRPFKLDRSGPAAATARHHRHRRTRPRDRRRLRAGLGASPWRRTRHRQIDSADSGLRRDGREGPARRLYFRRRGGRSDPAARPTAWPCRGAGRTRRRDQRRGYCRDALAWQAAVPRRHRFHPDDVDGADRIDAWHGRAGARRGASADPFRQDNRRGGDPCRTCHQGWPNRRSPRRRTYGRCGAFLRGRGRPRTSASCARSKTALARPTRSAFSR